MLSTLGRSWVLLGGGNTHYDLVLPGIDGRMEGGNISHIPRSEQLALQTANSFGQIVPQDRAGPCLGDG